MDKETFLLKKIADVEWDLNFYNNKILEANLNLELYKKELAEYKTFK
jgi:hypothetical protein